MPNINHTFTNFFEKKDLLKKFRKNGELDIGSSSIFRQLSLIDNQESLDMSDIIQLPIFDINGKHFKNKLDETRITRNIMGDVEDQDGNPSGFTLKMAFLALYASIKDFKSKFQESRETIENILNNYPVGELNEKQYIMLKKMEIAFGLENGDLDKFVSNKNELEEQLKEKYSLNELMKLTNPSDFIVKTYNKKQNQNIENDGNENNLKLFDNDNENIVSQSFNYENNNNQKNEDAYVDEDEVFDVELTTKPQIKNEVATQIESDYSQEQEQKILQNSNQETLSTQINTVDVVNDVKDKDNLNENVMQTIETEEELHNENVEAVVMKVENAAEKLISDYNSDNLVAFVKEVKEIVKKYEYLDLTSTLENIKNNVQNATFINALEKAINIKKGHDKFVYDDIVELGTNITLANIMLDNNEANVRLISSLKDKKKLEVINQAYTDENTELKTSTFDVYLDKDMVKNDFDNSFEKSINGRVVAASIGNIVNRKLSDETIEKLANMVFNVDVEDSYQMSQAKHLLTAQTANPILVDEIKHTLPLLIQQPEKSDVVEFVIRNSIMEAVSQQNMSQVNELMNFLKTELVTENGINKEFVKEMYETTVKQLQNKQSLSDLKLTEQDLSDYNIEITKKNKQSISSLTM
jgi:hypothetical protein